MLLGYAIKQVFSVACLIPKYSTAGIYLPSFLLGARRGGTEGLYIMERTERSLLPGDRRVGSTWGKLR
jgi:hypothetical protein